jgi:hypothetical protein
MFTAPDIDTFRPADKLCGEGGQDGVSALRDARRECDHWRDNAKASGGGE